MFIYFISVIIWSQDANIRNQKVIDDFSYGDHEGLEPNLPGVGSSREEEKISESNVGFQLLKKFGWKGDGEGLGKSGQGEGCTAYD